MVYEGSCVTEINSLEEYLHFIKDYDEKSDRELWYRGHWSNAWDLKPNLYRNAKMITGSKGEIRKLSYNFVNFKDEFLKLKEEILNKHLFDISGLNDFHIMFIAQHYGLLTPALDWTTDPLVALFFALDGNTLKDEEFPVIYILKPGFCNEHSSLAYNNTRITKPICIDATGNLFNELTDDLNNSPANHVPIAIFSDMDFSHRICRQSGKFTLHGAVGPLNYSWNNITIKNEKFVDEIKINIKAIDEIKKYLSVLNINKQTIYRHIFTPLDNICDHIKKQELEIFKNSIAKTNKTFL
ncbi:FRG domain-containing protein [Clostridium botulinum]|uniref:FRG domain-containing protein n=1 Tax=Clostridium TaxID=1485 RepID=UPI0013F82D78|nr:FRG domain-containing protein [Clostridium botulinum]MCS6132111.1 FRG domain-containing protein [Clostridium botulinum]NFL45373.1 FRG domain-containing protein [Clostridium botulinum]NFL90736.1 FRG domain-containing protein [Clostridium botulinum]